MRVRILPSTLADDYYMESSVTFLPTVSDFYSYVCTRVKETNYVAGTDSGTLFHFSQVYLGVLDVTERNKKVGRFATWVFSSRVRLAASDKTRRYSQPSALIWTEFMPCL